eukprot:TRINITY_DN33582_c0_g1_i1.p1 TRINITY_DN33582_c0_g1~~TRINITY_DN33582_c0_g1_i1.p1  ORF type:complete len:153 (+),score=45.44 TRINITY_DN33582_c0_g1_i1:503-961(+)
MTLQEAFEVMGAYLSTVSQSLEEGERMLYDTSSEEVGLEALFEVSLEEVEASSQALEEARQASLAATACLEEKKEALAVLEQHRSNQLVFKCLAEERLHRIDEASEALSNLQSPPISDALAAEKDVEMTDACGKGEAVMGGELYSADAPMSS